MGKVYSKSKESFLDRKKVYTYSSGVAPLQQFEFKIDLRQGGKSLIEDGVNVLTSISYPKTGITWGYNQNMIMHPIPQIQMDSIRISFYSALHDLEDLMGLYGAFGKLHEDLYTADGILKLPEKRKESALIISYDSSRISLIHDNRERWVKERIEQLNNVLPEALHYNEDEVQMPELQRALISNIVEVYGINVTRPEIDLNPQSRELAVFSTEITYKSIKFPSILVNPTPVPL